MSITHPSTRWSLFPSCPDPALASSAKTNLRRVSTRWRTISESREDTDGSLSHANRDRKRNKASVNSLSKPSPGMGRLIPFRLQLSDEDRSQITSPQPKSKSPTTISSLTSPTSTRKSRPGPVTDLIIIPYTEAEWKVVMEEVKILYLKGQYKQCSMRSKSVLENIKAQNRVHPLYSIYLSFFAASSLEQQARSLHNHSSNKLPLFQEALSFYQKAESFIEYASFSANPNLIHAIRTSNSISSSARSSVDSVFSQSSRTSTHSGSDPPTDLETLPPPPATQKYPPSVSITSPSIRRMKKNPSFSGPLSPLFSDSEHLSEETILDAFPRPPSAQSDISCKEPTQVPEISTLSSYLLTQSINRYRKLLTALSSQLSYHITSIHTQIAALSEIRRARRSNSPTTFSFFSRDEKWWGESNGAMEGTSREEVVKVDLRERIVSLKEMGWRRERFDGERYRSLCERALAEAEAGV